jgi:hypothetical protein
MGVRRTIEIPELLYRRLRKTSARLGASIGSLIVQAIEQSYGERKKGKPVTGPMIPEGRRGPAYPKDENPHDLVFS